MKWPNYCVTCKDTGTYIFQKREVFCPDCMYGKDLNKLEARKRLREAIENVQRIGRELDMLPEHIRDMFPKSDRFN
jgi:uncharacterized Zn finger protein (UPF0148 family)